NALALNFTHLKKVKRTTAADGECSGCVCSNWARCTDDQPERPEEISNGRQVKIQVLACASSVLVRVALPGQRQARRQEGDGQGALLLQACDARTDCRHGPQVHEAQRCRQHLDMLNGDLCRPACG